MKSLIPADIRTQLRAQISAIPDPRAAAAADEVADLTVLAVTEALEAIDRVAGRARSPGIAFTVLSASAATTIGILKRLEDALKNYVVESGRDFHEGSITLGGRK